MLHVHAALASALVLTAAPASNRAQEAAEQEPAPAPLELLDERALHEALTAIASEHPELASLSTIGRSREGRAIEALRLAAGAPAPGRPAILVVANIDGPLVYTTSLAVHHARELAARYGADERVTKLLDGTTLYVVPRANPDAAAARFATPLLELEATGAGVDDDRDGRAGEGERSDANGDGYVTTMRVLDPEGEWIADPAEPRVLVRAERQKGERGRWKLVPEGRDTDGDEEVGEDPLRDAQVNRNFAHAWVEHAPSSGLFPTDEPEALALCDFVLEHEDVALVLTYGRQANLGAKPDVAKGGGQRGTEALGWHEDDAALLDELGQRYREITKNETRGEKEEAGSFQAWCHHHRGLYALSIAPWSIPAKPKKDKDKGAEKKADEAPAPDAAAIETPAEEPAPKPEEQQIETPPAPAPETPAEAPAAAPAPAEAQAPETPAKPPPEPSEDAQALRWLEERRVEPAFLAWTAFEHPELGAVEVGGFVPYARTEPPADLYAELAPRELDFLIALGELLPRVVLVDVEAKELGGGLFEIEGALENGALLPLRSRAAVDARSLRPARVRLDLGVGATLLAGPRQELVSELAGSGGRRELRWLVRASDIGALKVEVLTDNAGAANATPEVK